MTNAGNDTGSTREEEFLARVYQQALGAQAARHAAAYDAGAGLAQFRNWLEKHAAADPELDADQAVARLYAVHYRSLVRLAALLVRDTATAEEVVQDAFVAMHGAWQRIGDAEKALSYLRQAVVNRSRSVLRHRPAVGRNPQEALPDMQGAGDQAAGLLERPAARAALRGLPDRQREAIVLRYYAGLSEDATAAAMCISRGAVKSHTARGMSALRAALGQAVPPQATEDADSSHE